MVEGGGINVTIPNSIGTRCRGEQYEVIPKKIGDQSSSERANGALPLVNPPLKSIETTCKLLLAFAFSKIFRFEAGGRRRRRRDIWELVCASVFQQYDNLYGFSRAPTRPNDMYILLLYFHLSLAACLLASFFCQRFRVLPSVRFQCLLLRFELFFLRAPCTCTHTSLLLFSASRRETMELTIFSG